MYSNAQFEYRKPHEIDILPVGGTIRANGTVSHRSFNDAPNSRQSACGLSDHQADSPRISHSENDFPFFPRGRVSPSTNREGFLN